MRRENATKNGEPTVGFSFMAMLQHTGWFMSHDFLSKNNVTKIELPLMLS
jgi:hypothetical protein